MTLIIETSDTRAPERDYILGVILGEFLGLDWQRVPSGRTDIRITLRGHQGEICMPDILMQTPEADWLTHKSLPVQPLPVWDIQDEKIDCPLVSTKIPVIYGDLEFHQMLTALNEKRKPNNRKCLFLPIDIFGSAFFMLTRYEEVVKPDRDEHNRFPARASLAFQENFLDRPIINEYLEILWSYIQHLTENQKRKTRTFQIVPTHDVDIPFQYRFKTLWQKGSSLAGDLVKRKSVTRCVENAWKVVTGNDPLNTFDLIMDISEREERTSSFYFMAGGKTHYEIHYPLMHPAVQAIIKSIHERGHHIGFHPSYEAGFDGSIWQHELTMLEQATEAIPLTGGRQHFLRFQTPLTWRFWAESELTYDTTLCFADLAGFRCGTCYPFPVFDVDQRVQLDIRERPLIVMECTVIDERYMYLGATEKAMAYMEMLKERCRLFDGEFVVLWHNTRFLDKTEVDMYSRLLE
jgi:hypothetical protein